MNMITVFLGKIWSKIVSIGKWLWSQPIILASIISAVVGGLFIYKSSKNKIDNLKDGIEIQKAKNKISKNNAVVKELEKNADKHEKEINDLKKEISQSKKRVVELDKKESLEGLNDEEIAKIFSDSGI